MMTKLSSGNRNIHYNWGNRCEGWNFVQESNLSVKQEKMPAGSAEVLHFHQFAQQFFFILSGKAIFEIEGSEIELEKGEGIHILPGKKHRIKNNSTEDVDFILCSQPSTENDRINCNDE